jgi:hypothetical protein
MIEGQARAMVHIGRGQVQQSGTYRQIAPWRDDIDMVGQQGAALDRFGHGHRGVLA